jgi:hypothetical protein
MLCDTRKGVVYGTRLSESGFAIANPYLSQVLRLFVGTPVKKVTPKNFVKGQKSLESLFLVLFSVEKRTGIF